MPSSFQNFLTLLLSFLLLRVFLSAALRDPFFRTLWGIDDHCNNDGDGYDNDGATPTLGWAAARSAECCLGDLDGHPSRIRAARQEVGRRALHVLIL